MNDTLEAGAGGAGFRESLRARRAAQTAITEFLRAQDAMSPRSRIDRIVGRDPLSEESSARLDDALGEIVVGEALDSLGGAWTVLHAVPLDGRRSDIDHMAIGPGGVFTLSTRNYSDQNVWIARDAMLGTGGTNHIRNSEFEIGRVERTLSAALGSPVRAHGVIVVVDPKSIMVTGTTRDVAVVTSLELAGWLEDQPRVLEGDHVERISSVAAIPGTWSSEPVSDSCGIRLYERFDEVRREIARAERVRRLWFATITTVLLASVALAAWGVMLATATPL